MTQYAIINSSWLKTCGKEHLIGLALEITRVRDFGDRGKFYQVKEPNGFLWEVWDYRGLTRNDTFSRWDN